MHKDTPAAIQLQAQELIDRVQRDLANSDAFFCRHGLDRQEVYERLLRQLTPHQRQEAQKAFQQELADIEQEVQEAVVRRSFANVAARRSRRPRSMV